MITKEVVIAALGEVYDPEIPLDLVTLGLIYNVNITVDNDVEILMTLTFPGCPLIDDIKRSISARLYQIPNIGEVYIHLTFNPPWDLQMIVPAARTEMNI